MAYVSVDIDTSEFSTDELVEELVSRLKEHRRAKALTEEHKKELREELAPLASIISLTPVELPEIKSLEDKLKAESVTEAWNKYSLSEFESRLK